MSIIRNHRRPARIATVAAALGFAILAATPTALAANTIDLQRVGPVNVEVAYNCEASAGVTAVKVMVGAPEAESPSATGAQNAVTCDGSDQTTVVMLTGPGGQEAPMSKGQTVQVRMALVDANDMVVAGNNTKVTLG
ncbi:hypothetical protein [Nocardia arthritidis]|uniref:Uncharacterized protein n=1 Tax=Nocardia arthritidis TaxID=228602 RepID=A0A6G9YGD3_9NOCA|nr:hypothetical protein [Nocardia arthritidis]QIS12289.1 hypothetical protein F5544_22135 [Nocardia arthritidis]